MNSVSVYRLASLLAILLPVVGGGLVFLSWPAPAAQVAAAVLLAVEVAALLIASHMRMRILIYATRRASRATIEPTVSRTLRRVTPLIRQQQDRAVGLLSDAIRPSVHRLYESNRQAEMAIRELAQDGGSMRSVLRELLIESQSLSLRLEDAVAMHERDTSRLGRMVTSSREVSNVQIERLLADAEALLRGLNGMQEHLSANNDSLKGLFHSSEHNRKAAADILGQLSSCVATAADKNAALSRQLMELSGEVVRVENSVLGQLGQGRGDVLAAVGETNRALRVQLEELPSVLGDHQRVVDSLQPGKMPKLGGWALTAPVVDFIVEQVLNREEGINIVELGSGSSTIWTAAAMRRVGRGHVVALEHLREFANATRSALDELGVADFATVHTAVLTQMEIDSQEYEWYDRVVVEKLPERIDVLLVDGPPGKAGARSRYPAVPVLADRLVPGSIIILDDTIREDERAIGEAWLQEFQRMSLGGDLGKARWYVWA